MLHMTLVSIYHSLLYLKKTLILFSNNNSISDLTVSTNALMDSDIEYLSLVMLKLFNYNFRLLDST